MDKIDLEFIFKDCPNSEDPIECAQRRIDRHINDLRAKLDIAVRALEEISHDAPLNSDDIAAIALSKIQVGTEGNK